MPDLLDFIDKKFQMLSGKSEKVKMAVKRMYLIKRIDGRRMWTEGFEKKDGFLLFKVKPQKGGVFNVQLNMLSVSEIVEKEFDKDDKPVEPVL